MHSSIFNSEKIGGLSALRVVALVAIGFCALYTMLLEIWSPDVRAGQDQQNDNAIAIERFLYSDRVPDLVIVGSSLAQHIPAAAFGPGAANLSLSGESPLLGLSIIDRSNKIPRRIFIEINQADALVDNATVDRFFAEPGYTLRRFLKALRVSYQPVNVVISTIRKAVRGDDAVYYSKLDDGSLHDDLVNRQLKTLNTPPDIATLQDRLAALRSIATRLAARGAQVILFEMPIEASLENAVRVATVRDAVHAAFPPDTTCWNTDVAPAGMPTRDGLHLDSEAAANLGRMLVQTVCR